MKRLLQIWCPLLLSIMFSEVIVVDGHESPWSHDEISQTCTEETIGLGLGDYLDLFWFIDEIFSWSEISSKLCDMKEILTEGEKRLSINCDWGRVAGGDLDEAVRGKGKAYEYVAESCKEQNGRMYMATFLNTTIMYDDHDKISMNSHDRPGSGNTDGIDDGDVSLIVESSVHHNLPFCIAPSCDPEEVIKGVLPCTQHFLLPYDLSIQWTHRPPNNLTCPDHDINIAHTYMDESCETTLTFPSDNENPCLQVSDDVRQVGFLCDFSYQSEPWGGDRYNPNFCDSVHANMYKYSYAADGYFDIRESQKQDIEYRIFLNYLTCLKKGCDVQAYYLKRLLPHHSSYSFTTSDTGSRDYETIIERVISIGILPVGDEYGDHNGDPDTGGSPSKKKGKKAASKKDSKKASKKDSKKASKKKSIVKKIKVKKTKKGTSVMGSWFG